MSLKEFVRVHEDKVTVFLMIFSAINAFIIGNGLMAIYAILLALFFKIDAFLNRSHTENMIQKSNSKVVDKSDEV